ncbi:MAG: cytochrome c biogenesis protein ResB, partial [Phycisphaerae bacterium]
IGTPIESPWRGRQFAVLRRFEHARVAWSLNATGSIREDRSPGLLLRVSTPEQTDETWVQKFEPRTLVVGGTPYELLYGNKQVPLGFALTLHRFRIGTYPGGNQPRSFESQVTTVDPATGREQSHVISMNNPAEHGRYTLYQSSYRQQQDGPTVSYLTVARDPGQPVVFGGYIALTIGMLVALGTRVTERRRKTRSVASETVQSEAPVAASASPLPEPASVDG